MIYATVGPEFILGAAAGQYESAHKAVQDFKRSGHPEWTMRHAFFADMGGFMLHTSDCKPFPINNKHIQWLATNNFMAFPEVSSLDIWDKSKADRLVKSIVCAQISWVTVSVVARRIQGLAVTTLELSTVSIVFCTVMTYFCWLQKPADVKTPIHLFTEYTMADILVAGGDAAKKPYHMTPLDFIDNLGPPWSGNVMAFAGIHAGPQERPLTRLPNDRFPHVRGIRQYLLIIMTLFSDGIHIFGWYFAFPSRTERIMWRVASLVMFCTAAVFWLAELFAGLYRDGVWAMLKAIIMHPSRISEAKSIREQRPSRPQPTPETFPLPWEFAASMTVFIMYLIARIYVLGEMFAGLRELPHSAYQNVNWTTFIPHVS